MWRKKRLALTYWYYNIFQRNSHFTYFLANILQIIKFVNYSYNMASTSFHHTWKKYLIPRVTCKFYWPFKNVRISDRQSWWSRKKSKLGWQSRGTVTMPLHQMQGVQNLRSVLTRYAATTKVKRNPAQSGTDGLFTKPSELGAGIGK